ncbi:hypothetical protein [Pasteurella multocida]|uniref:hypothetical protein n=1 Tax=Pasteurella multocida TaxID=747 RepID=UPI00111A4ECF|nr:hypothetical protein [Pasteurella multocida]MDY0632644.1 hypothetical protein [Pasteurella multocida]QDA13008.1 hypothetical protein E0L18_09380 [Pasteurella multocida subsp. multocida]
MNIIQSFTHRLSDLIKQYPLAMSFIFISTAFIPWIQDESISRDMIVVLLKPTDDSFPSSIKSGNLKK